MRLLVYLLAVTASVLANNEKLLRQFSNGSDAFTSRFFSEVVSIDPPGKSVVMSPFSVMQPLAQLSLAAVGESHDELIRAIGMPDDNVTRSVYPIVLNNLRSIKGVVLKTASKIYISRAYELNDGFAADSKSVFGTDIETIDFAKKSNTINAINSWVEQHTNSRIKNMVNVDTFDFSTQAVLINAIYFKGTWKTVFNKDDTSDHVFHLTKNIKLKLPTMYQKSNFKYSESEELDAKLLELPYEGEETSFVVVLPNEIEGLQGLQERLKQPSLLAKAIEDMIDIEIQVLLPKFRIESSINLKEVLQKIGVTKIFGGDARLERLIKNNSYFSLSEATQKVFIEVNEEGAEAAAVSEFDFSDRIASMFTFDANHPFVFLIKTKTLTLFQGVFRPKGRQVKPPVVRKINKVKNW